MHLRIIFIFIAALYGSSAASSAAAAEHRIETLTQRDDSFSQCVDASEGVTSNLMNCRGKEYERLNEIMQRKLSTIRSQMTVRQQRKLETSQLIWWQ